MQKIYVSHEAEAIELLLSMKPKGSVVFVKPSGTPIATWIVLAGIGELFTRKSVRRIFGKKAILRYDFYQESFSGESYAKEEAKAS
jgi:hypothetical protein